MRAILRAGTAFASLHPALAATVLARCYNVKKFQSPYFLLPKSAKSIYNRRVKIKFVLSTALLSASLSVFASFELMLLPGADGRTYRYDPVNNISLGSYRTGSSNITNIAASTAGLAYGTTSSGSGYYVNEYSTGNALPLLSGPNQPLSTDLLGNTLYILDSFGALRRRDLLTSTTVTTALGAGVTWRTGTVLGGRYYAAGVNGTNNIVLQNVNLTTNAVSSVITTSLVASGVTGLGKMAAFRNNNWAAAQGMFVYLTSGGGFNTFRFDINADGSVPTGTPTTGSLLNFGTANFIPATMASHDGFKVVGQDSTVLTNYRINHYAFSSGILAGQSDTFAATGGTRTGYALFQPALIVAPEPGTMIALGLGLAGIMRRRSRKPSA